MACTDVPDLDRIPGDPGGTAGAKQPDLPDRWRVPRTEITIVRVEEGPRAGEYLFSADTVAQAPVFYEAVSVLSPLRPIPVGDLYRLTQMMTGWMIPLA